MIEGTEDGVYMTLVFFCGLAEYEDVIQIDNAELIDVFSQNLVHSSLKGTGCIGQAEGEYVPFVMTISRGERCLSTRKQAENDLPVTRAQVDAREVLHTKESKEGLVDSGEWVCILDRDLIEGSVIDTDTCA